MDPDHPGTLDRSIGLGLHLVLEILVRRHARHVHAGAGDVVFPAVIDAADAATLDAAQRAAQRGLRLAILSNAPLEMAKEIDAAPWLAPFTRRFFSCHLRAVKPEPAAYQAVLAALSARPEEVVFFDDRPVNVVAAAQLGIDARLFEAPAQLDEVTTRSP